MPYPIAGLSYDLGPAASLIVNGDCRALWVGDSLSSQTNTPRMMRGIIQQWPVRWKGIYCPPFSSAPQEGAQTFFDPSSAAEPQVAMPGGVANQTALYGAGIEFASNVGNLAAFHKTVFNFTSVAYRNGVWGSSEPLKMRIIYRKPSSPAALSDCRLAIGRDNVGGSFPAFNFQINVGVGTSAVNFDLPAPTGQDATGYSVTYSTGVGEDETGKSFLFNGHTVYSTRTSPGFMLGFCAYGGWSTKSHIDNYTVAMADRTCRSIFPQALNLIVIMLGTNQAMGEDHTDPGTNTYYNNIVSLGNKWVQAVIDASGQAPQVLLINAWETSNVASPNEWMLRRGDALEFAARTNGWAFLNLGRIVEKNYGAYSSWSSSLLSDGVHQNDAGANEFARLIWNELASYAGGGLRWRMPRAGLRYRRPMNRLGA